MPYQAVQKYATSVRMNPNIYRIMKEEMRMITVTRIETIDETSFNRMFCEQCNSKLGWKPRSAKVHTSRLTRRASARLEPVALPCLRCKAIYLITTDGE